MPTASAAASDASRSSRASDASDASPAPARRAVRIGVVQMTSTDDLDANLEAADRLVRDAVERGAELVGLPENFAYLRREGTPFPCAEALDGAPSGPIVEALRGWAREHGIWLLGGSFPESVPGDERVYNTSVLLAPDGSLQAVYRKIHLFDVDLSRSGGDSYAESASIAPGRDVVVAKTPFGPLGLSICYDLRFPELYRRMVDQGALLLAVPSAFTPHTGKDHWEPLLRARAIESQCFVLAPAQCGRHNPARASWGRSLVVDPWGLVLAQAADRPCAVVADCDLDDLARVRAAIPALRHRRL